jgi:nucleoid-associated protein YgaU
MARNTNRKKATNRHPQYEELFEDRNIKKIEQYRTKKLTYPSKEQIDNLELTKYYWRPNDNFYKISEKFYGDSKYWYIIAQFNKLPFEGDIKVGDTLMIPRPLVRVVQVMK